MTAITLRGITKRYGETTAVDAVDLEIADGELFFLLGPSGCGKTTLLRMIAGFIEPSAGRIFFGAKDVTDLAANKRNVGMVFQSYALWPHMSVSDNVAFGLNVRKVPRKEKDHRVMEALDLVQMGAYAKRKPNQLSGGQQQRVALARALVIKPTILLLDEPLSNLDAKLRLEMRAQIRKLCDQTGITTVYVTHDQKEALSMADRIAVLKDGQIVQQGGARELYMRPRNRFVCDFLGETNFIVGTVEASDNGLTIVQTAAGRLRSAAAPAGLAPGRPVTCAIRPESLRTSAIATHTNALSGKLLQSIYLGELAQHLIQVGPDLVVKSLELNPAAPPSPGRPVHLDVAPEHVVLLAEA
jgi:iron(III) transport system ATP-binding protein